MRRGSEVERGGLNEAEQARNTGVGCGGGAKWSEVASTTRIKPESSSNRRAVSFASPNRSRCYEAITQPESIPRAGSKCRLFFAVTSKRSMAQLFILPA